jgi:hypothetical protein
MLALPPAQIFDSEFKEIPKIDEIFVITRTGLLLKHFSYKQTTIMDEDILSSMLTVVQNFITQSFNQMDTTLKELVMGNFNIIIGRGQYINIVVISPEQNIKSIEVPLDLLIKDIETKNDAVLKAWDGSLDGFIGIDDYINNFVNGSYLKPS